jgi:hypothetical protein
MESDRVKRQKTRYIKIEARGETEVINREERQSVRDSGERHGKRDGGKGQR